MSAPRWCSCRAGGPGDSAYFASLAFPPAAGRGALAALAEAAADVGRVLETNVDLSAAGWSPCSRCWTSTRGEARLRRLDLNWPPWRYDAERYERVAAERDREQQAMLAYQATDGCRMEYLRRQLDNPAAASCGRCDNCTGQRVQGEVPEASSTAARERLLRPGVEVEPRRMWPTGLKALGLDVAGKIPATLTAEPGRAIGRLTDMAGAPCSGPCWPRARPTSRSASRSWPTIKVLAAWDWAQRPAGVLTCRHAPGPG